MSNEYKDYVNDLRAIFNDKMREAAFLYEGWCNSFIPNMMDELFDALGPYVEDFEVYQIKEKYAALEIYHGWKDREYTEEEWAEKKAQRMAWRNAIREIEKDFVEPTMTLEEMREAERKAMEHINTEEENG